MESEESLKFEPDYRHFLDVVNNKRPARLPLYEHLINTPVMEKVLNVEFSGLLDGSFDDLSEYFHQYCRFYHEMTYDTVSFEVCITEILPGSGALCGGHPGPIQNKSDFEKY